MNLNNPVIAGAGGATAFIVFLKALIPLGQSMHWWTLDADQTQYLLSFIDTAIPIVAVWGAAIYSVYRTTSLDKPRDRDGVVLTRPDNSPAIGELNNLQTEAIKIDKVNEVTRGFN